MFRTNLIGRENRLVYLRASQFGYTSTTTAKKDTRDLSRQVQTQQQSNLDAQREQQERADALNAFERERADYAASQGQTYDPTQYTRTAGTADKGITLTGNKTTLDANGNLANDPFKVSGSGLTMDRSLPTSDYGQLTGKGVIDQSAIDRLRAEGLSDSEISARLDQLAPQVQSTMTNTGQGVKFDPKTGMAIAGSGRLNFNDPGAKAAADLAAKNAAELEGTVGYTKVVTYDENGNAHESYVADAGATANAREAAKNRQGQEAYARAVDAEGKIQSNAQNPEGGAGTGMLPPEPPSVNLDSFLATVPPEQQQAAASVFGPIFDYLEQAKQFAKSQAGVGMDAIEAADANIASYLKKQQDSNNMLYSMFKDYNDSALENQLDAAERTREQEEQLNAYEQQKTDDKFDRAIRNQMVKNEKDRKDQLLGLGVSGGWRSSRHSADVITALAEGDRIIADLETDAAFANEFYVNKAMEIKNTYQSNLATAYDKHKAGNLQLFQTMSDRAAGIDKTVYDYTSDKIKDIAKLKTDYIDTIGNLAAEYAKTVKDQNKWVIDQTAEAKKAEVDGQNKALDDAFKYIDRFGTQNTSALREMEKRAGVTPGTFTNQKSLEELRMKKSGGGGGGLGGGTAIDIVTSEREKVRSLYPLATGEQIDKVVWSNLHNLYGGGGASGDRTMRDVYTTMLSNPVNGERYSFAPFPPSSAIGKIQYEEAQTQLDDQYQLSQGILTPEDLFNDERFTSDQEAYNHLEKLGYVRSDWFGEPEFKQK